MRILTLSTCHNRRAQTVSALRDLNLQLLPQSAILDHFLVDDGSTDGTEKAIRAEFPDVKVLRGTGELYWAGGMRFGWERAIKDREFDYLFVYNDDARLEPDALACLLDAAQSTQAPCVVAGSFQDAEGRRTTYGGRRRSSRWHPLKFGELVEPNDAVQQADTLNMNGALISRSALDAVGFLSDYFVHSGADFEFGLKLRKAGGEVLVAPRHIGRCEFNPRSEVMPQDALTLTEGWRRLFDPKREPFRQRLAYYRNHAGWLWPVRLVMPYLTFLPRYVLLRLSGSDRRVTAP